jgi:hypothetical protein
LLWDEKENKCLIWFDLIWFDLDLESKYGSGFKQTKLILYTKEKKRNIMLGELYGELEASLRAWTFFFVVFWP